MNTLFNKIKTLAGSRNPGAKISYSQSGEDLIMNYILTALNVTKPTYLDVGANHPQHFNNTYIFYLKGSQGVNIEADPDLHKVLEQERSKDKNLNIGVGLKKGTLDFYRMNAKTLNTFSKQEAERYVSENNYKIESVITVNVDTINNVIENYCGGVCPDILSVDVEGLDKEIIKSLDFTKYQPKVICVESISFSEKGQGVKDVELIRYIESKGYMIYADTYVNTIFVLEGLWKKK